MTMSAERQKAIDKLQEVTISLMLQLQERDKLIKELKQNSKGKYYSMSM